MYRFSPLLASQGRDIAYAPRTVGHGWKTVLLIADLQADPGQQGFTVQAPKPIRSPLILTNPVRDIRWQEGYWQLEVFGIKVPMNGRYLVLGKMPG